MNWKKLLIGITIANLLGWSLLELWVYRYADGVAQWGAFWLIFIHLAGYYIIAIGSRITVSEVEAEAKPIQPQDCPRHDWQKSGYSEEKCIICNSERKTD